MLRDTLLRLAAGAVLLALALPGPSAAQGPSFFSSIEAAVSLDAKAAPEAKVFANAERTVFLVCPPGEYVYKVHRKERRVLALRRPSVLVKPDRCRPMEGAAEQHLEGHLFAETKAGFSFNDLAGRKVSVEFPPGTLR